MTPTIPPSLTIPIIGYHRSPLSQKFGIPRQPNLVDIVSHIEMVAPFNSPDAFDGIEGFSHLWITWQTHQNHQSEANQSLVNSNPSTFKAKVRPPRLGGNSRLGVFATRSTYRPSQLGLSVVSLVGVEKTQRGMIIQIKGADMVDGTPIIDIKPYIAYSDALPEAVSGFAANKPDVKKVSVSEAAQHQFEQLIIKQEVKNSLSKECFFNSLSVQDIEIICQLIAQDPRPAYRQQELGRVFVMRYKNCDIGFEMLDDHSLEIVAINEVI